MAEYTEKSAVLAMIDAFAEENRNHGFSGIDIFDIEMMKMRIEQMPAADVAPVVHGHWLTWEEQFPGLEPRRKNNLGVYCSSCHTHSDSTSPYCSICGAKMDGEENND